MSPPPAIDPADDRVRIGPPVRVSLLATARSLVGLAVAVGLFVLVFEYASVSTSWGATATAWQPPLAPSVGQQQVLQPTERELPRPASAANLNGAPALWPWGGAITRFRDPREVARSFAQDYVGFHAPVVVEGFESTDDHSGRVTIRATETAPATVVHLHRLGPNDTWTVIGAAGEDIIVDQPKWWTAINDPLRVWGEASSASGKLEVELRSKFETEPLLRREIMTGSRTGRHWFEGTFGWTPSPSRTGAVLVLARDPLSGRIRQATAIGVTLPYTD